MVYCESKYLYETLNQERTVGNLKKNGRVGFNLEVNKIFLSTMIHK